MFPKPEPRRREKPRRARAERAVKQAVREQVVLRDGYCRIRDVFVRCRGLSTWNHLRRRSETRNLPPEERHTTATSIMNCQEHHRMIDEHEIGWTYVTERQADGPMTFSHKGRTYSEASRIIITRREGGHGQA